MKTEDEYYDEDEPEITSCPRCGIDYDEIDQEYLICHHCGWDAEKGQPTKGNRTSVSMKGYGIDPDATHAINKRDLIV